MTSNITWFHLNHDMVSRRITYAIFLRRAPHCIKLSLLMHFAFLLKSMCILFLFSRLCLSLDIYPGLRHSLCILDWIGCCLHFVTLTASNAAAACCLQSLNLPARKSCMSLVLMFLYVCRLYCSCLRFSVCLSLDCRCCYLLAVVAVNI